VHRLFLPLLCAAILTAPAAGAPAPVAFLCDAAHTGVCPQTEIAAQPKPLWRFFTDRLNRSTPAYHDGVLFVGSNSGMFYALDAGTGRPRWSFAAHEPVASSPAVSGGRVYFAAARTLYALDERNGRPVWRHAFGPDLPHPGHQWDFFQSSPTVVGSRLFVGSGDGSIDAFDAATGRAIWKYRTGGRVRLTPAVWDGAVYAGSFDGAVYALNAQTGALLWRFKTAGNPDFPIGEVQSSPSIDGGTAFFGSRDGFLYAVDARTGTKKWSVDENESWVISSPAVQGGIVYYGSSDGNALRAVDEATGARKWSYDAQGRVWSSPVLVGGRAFIGAGDGEVWIVDAATGKMSGYLDSEGTIYSSVCVANGSVFYTSDDGYVYAAR